jgi:hypothetical protein
MKTLADLKRALVIGAAVKMTSYFGDSDRKNKLVGVVRYVVKVNTTGVYLAEDKTATKGSFLDWPKASLLEFDGKAFKIFQSGVRPLTDTEKRILDGKPVDAKQSEIDMMTDGSQMFYREKRYFSEVEKGKYMYLFGCHRLCGKLLTWNRETNEQAIDDDDYKGVIGLEYELV